MSPITADALAGVPVGPRVVRVYLRHCFIPSAGDPDPLRVNPAVGSRWWTPRGTLYVAEDPDTVMAEHCRNNASDVLAADPTGGVGLNPNNFAYFAARPVGPPLLARALFSVEVSFNRLADLRSQVALDALAAADVRSHDLLADNYGPCPTIAQLGQDLGWEALRAQSAAYSDGTALAIFHDAFPPADRWHMDLATARPAIRLAYLTRYRAGERPHWLGH